MNRRSICFCCRELSLRRSFVRSSEMNGPQEKVNSSFFLSLFFIFLLILLEYFERETQGTTHQKCTGASSSLLPRDKKTLPGEFLYPLAYRRSSIGTNGRAGGRSGLGGQSREFQQRQGLIPRLLLLLFFQFLLFLRVLKIKRRRIDRNRLMPIIKGLNAHSCTLIVDLFSSFLSFFLSLRNCVRIIARPCPVSVWAGGSVTSCGIASVVHQENVIQQRQQRQRQEPELH